MHAGQGVTGGTTTQYPSRGPPGVVNDALLAGGDRSAASFAMFRPGVAVSRPNLAKAGDSPRFRVCSATWGPLVHPKPQLIKG